MAGKTNKPKAKEPKEEIKQDVNGIDELRAYLCMGEDLLKDLIKTDIKNRHRYTTCLKAIHGEYKKIENLYR